jgi:outer membrane lipoprotein carrier protein
MIPDFNRVARVLAVAFLVAAGTAGVAAGATLDRLREFVRETQTARAQFTQTVVDRAGRTTQSAQGEFLLSRPGKFRWTVDKPYKQLIVGDGEKIWFYDEDLQQVIVRGSRDALGATPAALLAGREDVEKAFSWQDLPASDGRDWLAATPPAKDAAFAEIRRGFDARGLVALELLDAFGQRSSIRFTAMQRNPKLPSETFRFVPPKGADVLGETR